MKLDFRSIVKPAFILFLICLVAAAALAGTNVATKTAIETAQLAAAEESRKVVFPEADSFEKTETHYLALKGTELIGYVFETESKGYGGTLKVMTGIDTEGSITGVAILSHGETPGLGANATKESFTDQYRQSIPENGLSVTKGTAGDGEIAAITGATITTDAVTDAVNAAVSLYHTVKGGA